MRTSSICRYGVPIRTPPVWKSGPVHDVSTSGLISSCRERLAEVVEQIGILQAERETLEAMIRASGGEP
jgi:hypothetical protein